MSAPSPSHELIVGPASVAGAHAPDLDLQLCADLAQTVARAARTWAADAIWTGLGGFDASGSFWLGPHNASYLIFSRAPLGEGWLRSATEPAVALDRRFPAAVTPAGCDAPLSFALLQARVRSLPGFGGCALRHPSTGLWKTVIAPADATEALSTARLSGATRAFIPLSRMLTSQGLPVGRLLLTSAREAGIAWRTPGKVYGYLHLHDIASLSAAAALVDLLLLCTANADRD